MSFDQMHVNKRSPHVNERSPHVNERSPHVNETKRCYPREQLGFFPWEKDLSNLWKKPHLEEESGRILCLFWGLLSGKKARETHSTKTKKTKAKKKTKQTTRQVVKSKKKFFAVKDHQPFCFFFKVHFKKELTRKAVLDRIRLSKTYIRFLFSTVSFFFFPRISRADSEKQSSPRAGFLRAGDLKRTNFNLFKMAAPCKL